MLLQTNSYVVPKESVPLMRACCFASVKHWRV